MKRQFPPSKKEKQTKKSVQGIDQNKDLIDQCPIHENRTSSIFNFKHQKLTVKYKIQIKENIK